MLTTPRTIVIMTRPTHAFPNGRPSSHGQNPNANRFESLDSWTSPSPSVATRDSGGKPPSDGGWGSPALVENNDKIPDATEGIEKAAPDTASVTARSPIGNGAAHSELGHSSMAGPPPGACNAIPVAATRTWGKPVNQDTVNEPGPFADAQEKINTRNASHNAKLEQFNPNATRDGQWKESNSTADSAPEAPSKNGHSSSATPTNHPEVDQTLPSATTGDEHGRAPNKADISRSRSSSGLHSGWMTEKGETVEESDIENDCIDRWWLKRKVQDQSAESKIWISNMPYRTLKSDEEAQALLETTFGKYGTITYVKVIRSFNGTPSSAHICYSSSSEALECLKTNVHDVVLSNGDPWGFRAEKAVSSSCDLWIRLGGRTGTSPSRAAPPSLVGAVSYQEQNPPLSSLLLPHELIIDVVPVVRRSSELVWHPEYRPSDAEALRKRNDAVMEATGVSCEEVARIDCSAPVTDREIVRKLCSMFGFVQRTTHSSGGWHIQFEDRSEASLAHSALSSIPGATVFWGKEPKKRPSRPYTRYDSTVDQNARHSDRVRLDDDSGWPSLPPPTPKAAPGTIQSSEDSDSWANATLLQPISPFPAHSRSDVDAVASNCLKPSLECHPSSTDHAHNDAVDDGGWGPSMTPKAAHSPGLPSSHLSLEPTRTVIDDLEEQVYYKDEQRNHRPSHNRAPSNETRRPPSVMSMGTVVSNSRTWTPRAEAGDGAVSPTPPVNSQSEAQQFLGEARDDQPLSKQNGQTYKAVDSATGSQFDALAEIQEPASDEARGQIFTSQYPAGHPSAMSTSSPSPPPTHSAALSSTTSSAPMGNSALPSASPAIQPNLTSGPTGFLATRTTAIPQLQQLQQNAISMAQQAAFIPPFPPPYWPSMQMATPGGQMAMAPYPYGMYQYPGLPQMSPMQPAPQVSQASQNAYAAWQSSMAMHSYAMTYGVPFHMPGMGMQAAKANGLFPGLSLPTRTESPVKPNATAVHFSSRQPGGPTAPVPATVQEAANSRDHENPEPTVAVDIQGSSDVPKQLIPKSFINAPNGMVVAVYDDDELSAWRKAKGPEGFPSLAPETQIDPASVSPVTHIAQNYVQPSVAHVHPWLQQVQAVTAAAMPSAICVGAENTSGIQLSAVPSLMTPPQDAEGPQQPLHPSQADERSEDTEQGHSQIPYDQPQPQDHQALMREVFPRAQGSPNKPEHSSLKHAYHGSWKPPHPPRPPPHQGHNGHCNRPDFSGPPRPFPPSPFDIADKGFRVVPYFQQHQLLHQSPGPPRPRDANRSEWDRSAFRAAGLPISPESGPNRHR